MLGEHVKQQGSMVGPDRLRFDFSHHAQVTPDELRRIEDLANHEILDNAPVHHFETTMDEARRLGAIMFFGDKYGEVVRVLEAGRHSIELCGGTHVRALGDIGPLKVVSESSIGSNIRRIEAVSGTGPIDRLRAREAALTAAADLLGVTADDILEGIGKRAKDVAQLEQECLLLLALAQRLLCAGALERCPGAFGNTLHQGNFVARPGARLDTGNGERPAGILPAFSQRSHQECANF